MSLVNVALRICAKQALLNATYAGTQVHDSTADVIDPTAAPEKMPLIIISIDQEEQLPRGKDVFSNSSRNVSMIIECAVATKMTVAVEGSDPVEAVEIPQTDSGMETLIAIMVRQIWRALIAGDNEWSQLFRMFCFKFSKIMTRRGAGADGIRYAARQIIIDAETLAEPYIGMGEEMLAPGTAWDRLLTAMAGVPDLEPLSRIIRAEIANPELTDIDLAAAALGITRETAHKIGLGQALPFLDPGDPLNQNIELMSGQGEGFPQMDLEEVLPAEEDE